MFGLVWVIGYMVIVVVGRGDSLLVGISLEGVRGWVWGEIAF